MRKTILRNINPGVDLYSRIFKRLLDFTLSLVGFLFLAPLMLCIIFLIKTSLGRPLFFIQRRPGLYGKSFHLYKFRTMAFNRDAKGELLNDEKRLTVFGRLLRSTSLDELPEILNVLKGEMSLVGPRPLLMQYLDRYTPEQARRHEVKPGITGWAQVNGRNAITWEQKFEYDVWYVDNQSFALDLKILWMTLIKVLKREGISHPGQATMEEFMGSNLKQPSHKKDKIIIV